MAYLHPVISRFQRNTERVRDLELPPPGTEPYEKTKEDYIVRPFNEEETDKTDYQGRNTLKIANDENSFLDIGLYLDCIGGSRANSFFAAPLGYRNTGTLEFNQILTLSHKRIVCAYGNTAYNFSSALSDLVKHNDGKNYIVHTVAFTENMANKVHNDFHPSFSEHRRKTYFPRYSIRELHYERGIAQYLKRLQLFRKTVELKISKHQHLVSNGRKTKLIFLFLDEKDCETLKTNKEIRADFDDIVYNGHNEKILLIPCVKNIDNLPMKTVDNADMVLSFGKRNSKIIQKLKSRTGSKIKIADEYNEFKTVGLVYDKIEKPYLFPLDGFTKEFYEVKEKLEKWEQEEEIKYFQFLDSLDDGSKYEHYEDTPSQDSEMFTRKEALEKELKLIQRVKPIITFE